MEPGSYSLLIRLEDTAIEIGALGQHQFDAGWYVYNGSAFGPGGLKRVDRHAEVFTDGTERPHWHIDYIGAHPGSELVATFITEDEDLECRISAELPGRMVDGIGASDCGCGAHLLEASDRSEIEAELARRHDRRYRPPGL
jgi:endonuclease-3